MYCEYSNLKLTGKNKTFSVSVVAQVTTEYICGWKHREADFGSVYLHYGQKKKDIIGILNFEHLQELETQVIAEYEEAEGEWLISLAEDKAMGW